MVGLLTALPNTQLWRRLKAEGRLLKSSLGNNTLADLNFIPRMDSQVLLDGYQRILSDHLQPARVLPARFGFPLPVGQRFAFAPRLF